jgi:hypothetical protein
VRISVQKDHGRLDVLNEWLRRKCPRSFTMDYEGKTYKVGGGKLSVAEYSGPVRESPKKGSAVTYNRVCLACQKSFYSKRRDAKYCSQRCRQRAKRDREARRQRAEYERGCWPLHNGDTSVQGDLSRRIISKRENLYSPQKQQQAPFPDL